MKLVCISGNFSRPSRTLHLAEAIAREFTSGEGWETEVFDLIDAGPALGTATTRKSASSEHAKIWDAVEQCDALVVLSPVYKASYSGLLKHFLDLLEADVMAGKPVLVGATGKAPQHYLMIEHQFRPLFAFFKALCIPTSLFAIDADFASPDQLSDPMLAKVRAAASELKYFTTLNQGPNLQLKK